LWHVTPAQALVWAECIHRRRSLRRAEELEASYLAMGAAQAGGKAFRALQSMVRKLREDESEQDPEEIIRALGLTDRRRR
jgi:hypothetical protein